MMVPLRTPEMSLELLVTTAQFCLSELFSLPSSTLDQFSLSVCNTLVANISGSLFVSFHIEKKNCLVKT